MPLLRLDYPKPFRLPAFAAFVHPGRSICKEIGTVLPLPHRVPKGGERDKISGMALDRGSSSIARKGRMVAPCNPCSNSEEVPRDPLDRDIISPPPPHT